MLRVYGERSIDNYDRVRTIYNILYYIILYRRSNIKLSKMCTVFYLPPHHTHRIAAPTDRSPKSILKTKENSSENSIYYIRAQLHQ